MTELHDLSPSDGSKKRRKRLGRGAGSGKGTTAGRGTKGQKARSGGQIPPRFEGGQMPLHRRIPKRGFTPLKRTVYQVVNLRDLDDLEGDEVSRETLNAAGLVGSVKKPVKLLGDGDVERAFAVAVDAISGSAKKKVEAAGGSVVIADDEEKA